MLSNQQIEANKQKFIETLRKAGQMNPERAKGIEDMINYLSTSDFFIAPASTHYHQSYKGGLCEHSLQVYGHFMKLIKSYNIEDIPEESVIIISLLHDLCKVDFYKPYTKGQYKKDANGKTVIGPNGKGIWEEIDSYAVREDISHMGHASSSLYRIMKYILLTNQEYQAVLFHMGFCDIGTYNPLNEISKAFEQNGLAFLLFMADMLSTYMPAESLNQ